MNDDDRVLRALGGATFGPDVKVTLPSGREIPGREIVPDVVIDVPTPPPPGHEEVMAQALALALLATEDTENERCIEKEAVFYLPYHEALLPGHIYSESGLREFKISHCCEYHFDEWFKEEDE